MKLTYWNTKAMTTVKDFLRNSASSLHNAWNWPFRVTQCVTLRIFSMISGEKGLKTLNCNLQCVFERRKSKNFLKKWFQAYSRFCNCSILASVWLSAVRIMIPRFDDDPSNLKGRHELSTSFQNDTHEEQSRKNQGMIEEWSRNYMTWYAN